MHTIATTIYDSSHIGQVHAARELSLIDGAVGSGTALCGYANSERTVFTIVNQPVTCRSCLKALTKEGTHASF